MTVTVLLFSSYAEALGASSVTLNLPGNATVQDLLNNISERAAPRSLPVARVAVNQVFASASDSLREGDEIAVIPPVAGG